MTSQAASTYSSRPRGNPSVHLLLRGRILLRLLLRCRQLIRLAGRLKLLEAIAALDRLLLLNDLLRLLLGSHALVLLLRRALHAPLGEGLVPHELAIHALHGHLFRGAGLLDAIAVVLVDLVVAGVILGLGHCGESTLNRTSWGKSNATHLSQNGLSQ